MQVQLGRYYLNSGTYEERAVTNTVIHESYNDNNNNNDIALLYLDQATTKPTIKMATSERSRRLMLQGTALAVHGFHPPLAPCGC